MKLNVNDIGGEVVKDNETYLLKDNKLLNNLVLSSTDLKPKMSTRGHAHAGQEEVYYFVKGSGKMELIDTNGTHHDTTVKSGDIIKSIDNREVKSIMEVSAFINASSSETINLGILRNESELSINVKPKFVEGSDSLGNKINKKIIGIKIAPLNDKIERERLGPATALFYAIKETWFVIDASWDFVISMFKGTGDTSQLGGPIKIAKITGQVAKFGVVAFLSIMAYISISLGFINLFPIPMLDGGHLMFYAFEKILGRPLTQKTQEGFFRIGLFLLLSLMFFTTFNDLRDLGLF